MLEQHENDRRDPSNLRASLIAASRAVLIPVLAVATYLTVRETDFRYEPPHIRSLAGVGLLACGYAVFFQGVDIERRVTERVRDTFVDLKIDLIAEAAARAALDSPDVLLPSAISARTGSYVRESIENIRATIDQIEENTLREELKRAWIAGLCKAVGSILMGIGTGLIMSGQQEYQRPVPLPTPKFEVV